MAIRPIDYQVLVPKTQQQSKENQILNDKNRFEHQQMVQQEQKNIKQQLQKINEFQNKDSPNIKDYREKNNKNSSKENKQNKSKNKNDHSIKTSSTIGSKIDLLI